MLGCARGFTWVVTDKTGAARRHALSLRGVLRWAGRWRSKLFVRECAVGLYLCFSGAWLSSELRSLSLFWFYGVYMWMQGLTYLVFGTSLVDSLNFEPDLPEALRRPYRRQLGGCSRRQCFVPIFWCLWFVNPHVGRLHHSKQRRPRRLVPHSRRRMQRLFFHCDFQLPNCQRAWLWS